MNKQNIYTINLRLTINKLHKAIVNNYAIICLLIICVICLTNEILFLNKGLDLSDEGFHLSRMKFPGQVHASLVGDHIYSSYLLNISDSKVSYIRGFNIIFMVTSCVLLAFGSAKLIIRNHIMSEFDCTKLIFLLSPSMILWQIPSLWIERVSAYNNLTAYLCLSGFGILFLININEKPKKSLVLLLGACIFLIFTIRPSSALSLGIAIALYFISQRSPYIMNIFKVLLIGIISSSLLYFLLMESPSSYVNRILLGLEFNSSLHSPHSISMIKRYILEIFVTIKFILLYNKYEILIMIVLGFTNKIQGWLLFILLSIILSYNAWKMGDFDGGSSLYWFQWRYYYIFATLIIMLITFNINKKTSSQIFPLNIKACILSFICMLSPFILAFGTDNIIMLNMNFFTPIYFIGVIISLILLLEISTKKDHWTIIQAATIIMCLGSSYAHLNARINGYIYTINLFSSGKNDSFTKSINHNTDNLYVKETLQEVNNELKYIFTQGRVDKLTYALNFTDAPGFNYLINLPHPIYPWTIFTNNNFTLDHLDLDDFNKSAIIIYSNDKNTLIQLDNYNPAWRNSHIPIKCINVTNTPDDKIQVYLPNYIFL